MTNKFECKPSEYYPGMSDVMRGAVERYLNNGIMPGSFMTAVLENNLKEAFGRADSYNSQNMKDIIGYLYNEIPSSAWGSKERVTQWLEQFKTAA